MDYSFKTGVELLESVRFVMERMVHVPGKKGIVLLASGLTTGVGKQGKLMATLRASGVPIYVLSMSQHLRSTGWSMSEDGHARIFQANYRLRELAKNSGGIAFSPNHPSAFPGYFDTIGKYLRNLYLLAYEPPDPENLKKKRTLRIDARADIDQDGKPDKLDVIHVKKYRLGDR